MQFNRNRLIILILITICLCAFIGRLWLAFTIPIVEHDDAISMLVATGHMHRMSMLLNEHIEPYMTVVPAATWQQMIRADGLRFGQIAYDISYHDRHMPLYFWVLNIWMLIFGSSIFSTVLLNILFDILTTFALYRFGRRFFAPPYAVFVIIVWLLSPISMYATLGIRPYPLLALAAVIFADTLYTTFYIPNIYRTQSRQSIFLILSTVFMLLIHYYAVFVIAAAGLAVMLRWIRSDFKRILWLGGQIATSLLIVVALHPGTLAPFFRSIQPPAFDLALALERILIFSLSFFVDAPYHRGRYLWVRPVMIFIMVVVPLVLIGIQFIWERKQPAQKLKKYDLLYVFLLFVINWVGIVGLYLYNSTPLSYRYFDHAAVFAMVLLGFIVHLPLLHRFRILLAIGIIALMIVSGLLTTREATSFYWNIAAPERLPAGNEFVIINIGDDHGTKQEVTLRGHALQVVYNLKPENQVIVAHIQSLLANPAIWLPEICKHDTTLLLGFPHEDLFQLIEEQGFTLESYPSYLYYTDTRKINQPSCE